MSFGFGFGSLMGVLNVGMSLYGHARQAREFGKQESFYRRQAEINRSIGLFNMDLAQHAGVEAVWSISKQTQKALSTGIASFATRGVELEGSPMLILGEIETMGTAKAQSAYFNAQVEKINAKFAMEKAISTAQNQAEMAKANKINSYLQLGQSLFDASKLFKSSNRMSDNVFNPANTFGAAGDYYSEDAVGISPMVRDNGLRSSSNSTIDNLLLSKLRF